MRHAANISADAALQAAPVLRAGGPKSPRHAHRPRQRRLPGAHRQAEVRSALTQAPSLMALLRKCRAGGVHSSIGSETLEGCCRDQVLGHNCRFMQGPGTDPAEVARLKTAIVEQRPVTVSHLLTWSVVLNHTRNIEEDGLNIYLHAGAVVELPA